MSSMLRSSKFFRYFVGLTRNIIISNRQEVDSILLKRSQHLAGIFSSNNFSSSSVNLQTRLSLERTVKQLDEDARRTGRIALKEVEDALNRIRHTRNASASQALMVIRCCGNFVPEATPEQRTQLVEEIWNTFEKIGVPLDISHYNALLKVYLENEHKFSPTDFLTKLEKNGIEPNRVTFQRLIAGYCQIGDIAGATKILEFMKEKQLPVSEGIFNALILGHSKAGDMESAEGILGVMRQASLEPSNESYMTLLCGYAQQGDKAAIDRVITECKLKDVLLTDKDILEIVFSAAVNGQDHLVDDILQSIRHMMGYNQEATNLILRLITRGKDDVAYKVLRTMRTQTRSDNSPNMSGHLLIKQLVRSNRPVEQILALCDRLEKDGHTSYGLFIAVEASFHHGNIDCTLELLRVLKQKNEPLRAHYFWPSLISAGKAGEDKRVKEIVEKMTKEFEINVNLETVKDYVAPYLMKNNTPHEIVETLSSLGVKKGQAVPGLLSYLINHKKLKEALELGSQYVTLNLRSVTSAPQLVDVLLNTGDVKTVVKLIHVVTSSRSSVVEKDEDVENEPPLQLVNRFLINLVSRPQTRHYTAEVLKQLLHHGLGISSRCAEEITSHLQGGQLTSEISQLLSELSSTDLMPIEVERPDSNTDTPASRNPGLLERIKERLKANNAPMEDIANINRSLIRAYSYLGDVENALRIKKEYAEEQKQEVTPGILALLLDAHCSKDDFEGAHKCLEEIKQINEQLELDSLKLLKVVKLYVQNNRLEEAVQLLKSANCRMEENTFLARSYCWQLLSSLADTTKDPEQVKKVLNILLEKKIVEAHNVLLGPVIKAYLLREDLDGALKEFENFVKLYRATPWKNEITMRLIEKEDAVNLQSVVDLSTQVHGEINSLYDLVFSFIECGRVRQARKILETPGLVTRNQRIYIMCEKYKADGKVEHLENLIEATKDLPIIDRAVIFLNLLEAYCNADEVDKALGLWTKMQDENVNVSDEFLVKLGDFLKSKGRAVPFDIPKLVPRPVEQETTNATNQSHPLTSSLLTALRKKDADEALKIKDSLENSGKQLSKTEVTRLMELLLDKTRLREATSLFTSVDKERFPALRTLKFLVIRLSQAGEVDMLKRVGERLSEDLKRKLSFNNRYVTAAVNAGRAQEILDSLEKEIDNATSPEEIDALAVKFPRGGIFAVLENPSHLEQVARLVDKYGKKGVSAPANCLSMFHLTQGEKDKAKEIFQHHNLSNSSWILFQPVLEKARTSQKPEMVEDLLNLVAGAPSITPDISGIIYSNLIGIHCKLGEYETALKKFEAALQTIPLEHFYPKTLEKLKEGLETKNIPFNYDIPPKRMNASSSSSSSSDAEPKKSVAASR